MAFRNSLYVDQIIVCLEDIPLLVSCIPFGFYELSSSCPLHSSLSPKSRGLINTSHIELSVLMTLSFAHCPVVALWMWRSTFEDG